MTRDRSENASGRSESAKRVDALAEWSSRLTGTMGSLLLFESVTGLTLFLLPFSLFNQFSVLLHTVAGIVMVIPVGWFAARHWWVRKKGNLSHYQLLGYISTVALATCIVSGLVLTWQGVVGPAIDYAWENIHLVTGIGVVSFVVVHLATVIIRKTGKLQARELRGAQWRFTKYSAIGCSVLIAVVGVASMVYPEAPVSRPFAEDYNWRFGEDRPFAPSLARLDDSVWQQSVQRPVLELIGPESRTAYLATYEERKHSATGLFDRIRQSLDRANVTPADADALEETFRSAANRMKATGSVRSSALAGSARCGSSGCHREIYQEWLPSAHRYSSLDDMFQRVQSLMVAETSAEHTRYCAGCHDPISLFSGAKNSGNITLSTEGANEGSSCIVCHSIVQTDVQGNGNYVVRPPLRYVYELHEGGAGKFVSDFLIRTYPEQHLISYSRPLYKTPEFCAACHKQYIDTEVNTDIGKVQGQNQYDSWKGSRWYHEHQPEKTLTCRECHMRLVPSSDPARGDSSDRNRTTDDGKHRSHAMVASNQYIPLLQDLEGAERHVELVEEWLRGDIEIPEIADRWTDGPVIRMTIVAPETVSPGQDVGLQVILTNNKTGHDFPTGPLDMIESWVELLVTDGSGSVVYRVGGLDESERIDRSPIELKSDGFDRKGELIDRHNLWDLVGASYKRTMHPGSTDTVTARFQCPSMARGRVSSEPGQGRREEAYSFGTPASTGPNQLTVLATLWYRKANPDFLDRVYGVDANVRSPVTQISQASVVIAIADDGASKSR